MYAPRISADVSPQQAATHYLKGVSATPTCTLNGRAGALIAVLIVGLTLVALVVAIGVSSQNNGALNLSLTARARPTRPRRFATATHVVGAPLRWNTDEGAFMVSVGVGKNRLQLVFDTGSSHLSVKGEGCRWTLCTDSCVVNDCPIGKDNNIYHPTSGTFVAPGERGAGTSVVLTYGSQEDTVTHYVDTLYLSQLPLSYLVDPASCRAMADEAATARALSSSSLAEHAFQNIIVHNVTAITGTSTSNLFGMARPPINNAFEKENGAFSLAEQLLGCRKGEQGNEWTLVLFDSHGWFIMGRPPRCLAFASADYVPLASPPEFDNFLTHFYVVPIVSFECGADLTTLRRVNGDAAPTLCLLDTGTTLTYGSPMLGPAMRAQGFNRSTGAVRLVVGDAFTDRQQALVYTADMLVDPEFPDTEVIQADVHNTINDYDSIFNGANVLLFGALMMRHRAWHYDAHRRRVGIRVLS